MKRLVGLVFLLCGLVVGLTGQEVVRCSCDTGACVAEARWGRHESSFTFPLGALVGLLPRIPRVAGLVIPDLKITLHESLFGTMRVSDCPDPCCFPGRKLRAATDVLLSGTTEEFGLPPTLASVTGVVRACDVTDNESGDAALGSCEVIAPFDIPAGGVQVSLVLWGTVEIPLYGSVTGKLEGAARVTCSCEGKPNAPPALRLPAVVMVPLGGEARFPIGVNDPDGDPVWIYFATRLEWLTVAFDLHKGEGIVRAARDAPVEERTAVSVIVYDLKQGEVVRGDKPAPGQFHHEVPDSFTVWTVRNNPPRAISGGTTISHGEGCAEPVRYAATDPDLPHNYGYQLYFRPEDFPPG